MATNYYVVYNLCKCCERYDKLHLGKDCYGWKFTFNGTENETFKDWIKFIKSENGIIISESGGTKPVMTLKQFQELVKKRQRNSRECKLDKEGYSFEFYDGEWS